MSYHETALLASAEAALSVLSAHIAEHDAETIDALGTLEHVFTAASQAFSRLRQIGAAASLAADDIHYSLTRVQEIERAAEERMG